MNRRTPTALVTLLINLALSTTCTGQSSAGLDGLSLKARDGRILFMQYDSIPLSHETLALRFRTSNDPVLVEYSRRYKRKDTWSGVLGGIGWGFVGIWVINEAANTEFYGTDGASNAWRRMVVGTSISFCTAGYLFRRSAKRQIVRGVEHVLE